jgi:TctA family transporter
MISDHDYSVFILRPLSAAIFALCLLLVLWPGVKKRLGRGGAEVT